MATPVFITAIVKAVHQGDTFVLLDPVRLPPVEKTFRLANIQTPMCARRVGKEVSTKEQAYAHKARQFVRNLCVGKKVKFTIYYKHQPSDREYGNVFIGNENVIENSIAYKLLKMGLGKIVNTRKSASSEYNLAEKEAKKLKLNLWDPSVKNRKLNSRRLKFKFNSRDVFEKYKNSTVRIIVESVITGSTMKISFPDHEVGTLHLTGVKTPGFQYDMGGNSRDDYYRKKKKEFAKPFARESKHFTETRLLHRSLILILDGIDNFGNFVGSIITKPKKNKSKKKKRIIQNKYQSSHKDKIDNYSTICFQEDLLIRGFGKYGEFLFIKSKFDARIRKAEEFAKKCKMRIYKDYKLPIRTLNNNIDHEILKVSIVEVLSGDTIRVRIMDSNNPNKINEERISLASIRAQRFAPKRKFTKDEEVTFFNGVVNKESRVNLSKKKHSQYHHSSEDDPFAIEAKLTLQNQLMESNYVTIKTNYRKILNLTKTEFDPKYRKLVQREIKENRRFCSVYNINNVNVSLLVVQKGYAHVVKQNYDQERSNEYSQLISCERYAKMNNLGIHSIDFNNISIVSQIACSKRLNDFTIKKPFDVVHKYFNLFKDKFIPCRVEKIYSGTRFKIFLFDIFIVINFTLSGVMCQTLRGPSNNYDNNNNDRPYATEARDFSEKNLLLKKVYCVFTGVDKGLNILGSLFFDKFGKKNYLFDMLSGGLVMLHPNAQKYLKNFNHLYKIQQEAERKKLNIWSDYSSRSRGGGGGNGNGSGGGGGGGGNGNYQYQQQQQQDVDSHVKIKTYTPKPISVRVTEIVNCSHFYMQTSDSKMKLSKLQGMINELDLDSKEAYEPKRNGEKVFAKYELDGNWYRGYAEINNSMKNSSSVRIAYFDFGNIEQVKIKDIRKYSMKEEILPQAKEVHLAFVKIPQIRDNNVMFKMYEDGRNKFFEMTNGRELLAVLEYMDQNTNKYYISLYDKVTKINIAHQLMKYGFLELYNPMYLQKAFKGNKKFDEKIQQFHDILNKTRNDFNY